MPAELKFYKEPSLPNVLEPHAWYLIPNGNFVEIYITDAQANVKTSLNVTQINSLIDSKLSSFNLIKVVATIANRDALNLTANTFVLVTDASADNTVEGGAALYIYEKASDSFIKLQEFNDLDLNFNDIVEDSLTALGIPKEDIQDAITAIHVHANLNVLDKFSEDANGLKYNGEPIVQYKTTAW